MPTSFEEKLIRFFGGQWFLALAWLAMVASVVVGVGTGHVATGDDAQGIFWGIGESFVDNPAFSATVNLLLLTAVGSLLLWLNKTYLFVRESTTVLGSAFYLLTMANPYVGTSVQAGTVLALIVVVGAFYVFSAYQRSRAQHSVFLAMVIATVCAMFHWAFVLLIVLFFIGFVYMRAMNWRSVVAAAMGIFVPFWIVLGLGIATLADFKPLAINSVWASLELSQVRMFIVNVAVTVLAILVITGVNIGTIANYRLQLRVYNAFFVISSALTIVAMVVDYRDLQVFLASLHMYLAVQLAHAFTISKSAHRYVYIVVLIVWCVASCIASLLM